MEEEEIVRADECEFFRDFFKKLLVALELKFSPNSKENVTIVPI
jgi:hypothetical protein